MEIYIHFSPTIGSIITFQSFLNDQQLQESNTSDPTQCFLNNQQLQNLIASDPIQSSLNNQQLQESITSDPIQIKN
jgi:hypothetical protein